MAKFNEYPAKTIPKDADKFMLYSAEDAANKLIDYDKLADAVLNKLTSKTFGLDAGTMTLPAALNQLNSNSASAILTKISKIPSGDKALFFRSGAENIVANTYLTIPAWSIGIYLPINQDAAIICVNPEKVTAGYKANGTWKTVKIS